LTNVVTYAYNYIDDVNKRLPYGVIAQELQEILPALVNVGDDEKKTLSVNYIEFIPIMINAIKEQQSIINRQDSKIKDLANAVAEIRNMLANNNSNNKVNISETAL